MLYITCYAFFASFLWQCFDLPHYAPVPQNMDISSGGLEMHEASCKVKVGQTGSDT